MFASAWFDWLLGYVWPEVEKKQHPDYSKVWNLLEGI